LWDSIPHPPSLSFPSHEGDLFFCHYLFWPWYNVTNKAIGPNNHR
jgi:hypothetical protein